MGLDTPALEQASSERNIGRIVKKRRPAASRQPTRHKIIPKHPVPVAAWWSEHIIPCKARTSRVTGHVQERIFKQLPMVIEECPITGEWFIVAVAFSKGEASSFASAAVRHGWGHDLEIGYSLVHDMNHLNQRQSFFIYMRRHP